MKQTPLEKRAARKARHGSGLDMNLVSLIDVFTILIFFLLSSSGVETLPAAELHQAQDPYTQALLAAVPELPVAP